MCLRMIAILLGMMLIPVQVARADEELAQFTPDVVYGHKDGLAMTMDIYRPEGERNGAAILFMVSGGWYSRWAPREQTQPLFQPYLDAGFTMIAVRHGSSPRYAIPEIVSDVKQAVRYVRQNADELGVDPNRLGAMGMSAGGHLALMLGTTGGDDSATANGEGEQQTDGGQNREGNNDGTAGDEGSVSSRVAAVVALVPPTDLRVAVWESPESLPAYRGFPALNLPLDQADDYSPVVHVTPDDAPALVIMGGRDNLVPPKHGEWIQEAFEREKVAHKLIVFPEAGHGLEGAENRQTLVREAVNWFQTHLVDSAKK